MVEYWQILFTGSAIIAVILLIDHYTQIISHYFYKKDYDSPQMIVYPAPSGHEAIADGDETLSRVVKTTVTKHVPENPLLDEGYAHFEDGKMQKLHGYDIKMSNPFAALAHHPANRFVISNRVNALGDKQLLAMFDALKQELSIKSMELNKANAQAELAQKSMGEQIKTQGLSFKAARDIAGYQNLTIVNTGRGGGSSLNNLWTGRSRNWQQNEEIEGGE